MNKKTIKRLSGYTTILIFLHHYIITDGHHYPGPRRFFDLDDILHHEPFAFFFTGIYLGTSIRK